VAKIRMARKETRSHHRVDCRATPANHLHTAPTATSVLSFITRRV